MPSRLREIRERKMLEVEEPGRWTQADLAERVGAARSSVRAWEAGKALPRPFYRRRLARILGVDLEELFP